MKSYPNYRKDINLVSINNHIQMLSVVVYEVVSEVGKKEVGVRLSPNGETQGLNDSDPVPLFVRAAQRSSEIGVAHLELREAPPGKFMLSSDTDQIHSLVRDAFDCLFIMNSDFDLEREQTS
ncbi:MAG: hypothetical protein EOO38_01150 [Cytophagaceae bacterium]|nr:MAG: hypothetical protein EOO38_01150 [Cytophagaceae bacterium]